MPERSSALRISPALFPLQPAADKNVRAPVRLQKQDELPREDAADDFLDGDFLNVNIGYGKLVEQGLAD